jgi:hypothetical protein
MNKRENKTTFKFFIRKFFASLPHFLSLNFLLFSFTSFTQLPINNTKDCSIQKLDSLKNYLLENNNSSAEEKDSFILNGILCAENLDSDVYTAEWMAFFVQNQSRKPYGGNISIKPYEEALLRFLPNLHDTLQYEIYSILAHYYFIFEYTPMATKYSKEAITIAERLGDKNKYVKSLTSLANITLLSYDYENAMKYTQKILSESNKLEYPARVEPQINSQLNYARIYRDLGQFDSVSYYLNKAEALIALNSAAIQKKSKDSYLFRIYERYMNIDDLENAKRAKDLFWATNSTVHYGGLVDIVYYVKTGETEKAKIALDKNQHLIKKSTSWVEAKYYQKVKDYQNYFPQVQLYIKYLKGKLSGRNLQYLHFINAQIEDREKERELEIRKAENDQFHFYLNMLQLSIGLILTFGGILYIFYRKNLKINRELKEKHIEIENQNIHVKNLNIKMQDMIRTVSSNAVSYIDLILQYSTPQQPLDPSIKNYDGIRQYAKRFKELSNDLLKFHFDGEDFPIQKVSLPGMLNDIQSKFSSQISIEIHEKQIPPFAWLNKDIFLSILTAYCVRLIEAAKDKPPLIISSLPDPKNPDFVLITLKSIRLPFSKPYQLMNNGYKESAEENSKLFEIMKKKEALKILAGDVWLDQSIKGETCLFIRLLHTRL